MLYQLPEDEDSTLFCKFSTYASSYNASHHSRNQSS